MDSSDDNENFTGFADESLSTRRINTSLLDQALEDSSSLFQDVDEELAEHPLAPLVPFEPADMAVNLPNAESKARGALETNLAQLARYKGAEMNANKDKARGRCIDICWSTLGDLEKLTTDRISGIKAEAEKKLAQDEWFQYMENAEVLIHEEEDAHVKYNNPQQAVDTGQAAATAQYTAKKAMLTSKQNTQHNNLNYTYLEMFYPSDHSVYNRYIHKC